MLSPKTLWRALALLGAAAGMGLLHNSQLSDGGIGLMESPLRALAGLGEDRFIDIAQAKAKWEANVTFIDAREEEFYTYEGHIRGALSLPYHDFERAIARLGGHLPPKDREVVCYCGGYGCEESTELAKNLMAMGYARVYVFEGGWPEWSEAGLPVEGPNRQPERIP